MASEDYLPLFRKARREHLGNIARVSAEIIKLYREAAADLAARAAASRKGSLTERWASEYAESLKKRTAELNAGLYEVTLQGLKRSAGLPTIAMGEWWEAVATTQGAAGQSFRDAFATTPDSVLAGIIEGGFYKDNKGLSERIWRVADSFEKDIGYIVNRGIAEKKSALELARDLEQYVKPPAKRDFDWGKVYPNLSGKKVDFNAQRLARTSINHAYHLDNVKVCTENPFVTAMHWDLSNSHYERQVIPYGPDECDEYAAHDEGLGEGNWKPEEIPVPHPQCLCAHWPVIPQDLEDIGAQIGRWASGEPDELLDEWYDKYGNQNTNGNPKEILREGLKYQSNGSKMFSGTSDNISRVFSPAGSYKDDKGNFDIQKAKADLEDKIDTVVSPKCAPFLRTALQSVEFMETDRFDVVLGYDANDDTVKYNQNHPSFGEIDFITANIHELSHRIDALSVQSWKNEEFSIAVSGMQALIDKSSTEMTEYCFQHDEDGYLSDILDGGCRGKYDLPYAHPSEYWSKTGNQEREIFANVFSLEAIGDTEKLSFLEDKFPELMKAYHDLDFSI